MRGEHRLVRPLLPRRWPRYTTRSSPRRSTCQLRRSAAVAVSLALERQADLAARHREIDVGENLRVEQRAVCSSRFELSTL